MNNPSVCLSVYFDTEDNSTTNTARNFLNRNCAAARKNHPRRKRTNEKVQAAFYFTNLYCSTQFSIVTFGSVDLFFFFFLFPPQIAIFFYLLFFQCKIAEFFQWGVCINLSLTMPVGGELFYSEYPFLGLVAYFYSQKFYFLLETVAFRVVQHLLHGFWFFPNRTIRAYYKFPPSRNTS